VIKLCRIDDVDHINKWSKISLRSRQGFRPHEYVKYNTFVTFYAWLVTFPFLFPFHIIFLLTSTGQTGKPISMVDGSNDAFPPKEVPFWVSLKKIDFTGSVIPKNRQKVGVVLFPSQTRRINKNSYLSQIKRYRHRI
jgi:hypothetical protein